MKDHRSMKQHWCRSTVMPEYGLSLFYDRWSPKATTNYQNTLGWPKILFMCFLKPLLTAKLSIILFYCFLLGFERRSILLQRLIGTTLPTRAYVYKTSAPSAIAIYTWPSFSCITPLVLSLISYLLYYSDYKICYCLYAWVIHLVRFRDFMSLMSNW